MSGEIDAFQLACHLVTHLGRRDNVDNIQNLFDYQLAGNQVGGQFLIVAQHVGHNSFPS
ncbi:hypothetical protein D3C87_2119150 [compost metagenome]